MALLINKFGGPDNQILYCLDIALRRRLSVDPDAVNCHGKT